MRLLIFMDGLRSNLVFGFLVLLLGVASCAVWAPRMAPNWRRTATRALGLILFAVSSLVLCVFLIGFGDPPRVHFGFTSNSGSRVALLSHSSLRDGAATRVTVKSETCCGQHVAYEYFGDDDDYMGAKSVEWLDDQHLVIRYVLDPSGEQKCQPKVADVLVLCEPQPNPFPTKSAQGGP